MNRTTGYYSLIQYCPDLGRLEGANIGVLLFSPEHQFLKAVTNPSNGRIKRFFGPNHSWSMINSYKKGIEHRIYLEKPEIRTLEQLKRFIAQRANLIQITDPRPMAVGDPEIDLKQLFDQFFQDDNARASRRKLRRFLENRLSAPEIQGKIRKDIKVRVPALQKDLEIPFGFQNGSLNLIKPASFESGDLEQSVATACKYAVQGHSLRNNPDPRLGPLQLVIVGAFRPEDEDSYNRVRDVFLDQGVKLFKTSELSSLIEEIRTTGEDLVETQSS